MIVTAYRGLGAAEAEEGSVFHRLYVQLREQEARESSCPGRVPGESIFECQARLLRAAEKADEERREQKEATWTRLLWIIPLSIVGLGLVVGAFQLMKSRRRGR